ncbi:hypothetical protein [Macrococcus equipercicus]|uniref:Uncharacterized protein n=1 Tax=Macrococcus equipercicus TaxID=69967 RepID=A0A9Q9BK68_9STAP|nr:hypothetical protein [Macrococcus equipercicus]UTH13113.1 hypothetical protein KFV11_07500 [Macrococcus equipercicus]
MGFYYAILLVLGISLMIFGWNYKKNINVKVIALVCSVLMIASSLLLFLPGSDLILDILINQ